MSTAFIMQLDLQGAVLKKHIDRLFGTVLKLIITYIYNYITVAILTNLGRWLREVMNSRRINFENSG